MEGFFNKESFNIVPYRLQDSGFSNLQVDVYSYENESSLTELFIAGKQVVNKFSKLATNSNFKIHLSNTEDILNRFLQTSTSIQISKDITDFVSICIFHNFLMMYLYQSLMELTHEKAYAFVHIDFCKIFDDLGNDISLKTSGYLNNHLIKGNSIIRGTCNVDGQHPIKKF